MSRRLKSRLQQRLEYALYRMVTGLVHLSGDDRLYRWGGRIGSLARTFLRGRDRLALHNLRITFPEKQPRELREILNRCWRHFGRQLLLYLRAQRMSMDEVMSRVEVIDRHLVDEALGLGNGVIVISAHLGSWEIGGLALSSLAPNVHTVVRRLDNQFLERDLLQLRGSTGVRVIDRRNAARPLMKALAENAMVVMLPDQAVLPREGVLSPFLGRPAWTTPAPARMALRRGAMIVFAFCIPHKTRHCLEFGEPIRVDQLTDEERDPVALTARINEVISRRIIARPDLWLWKHDRWKGTGEAKSEDG